MSGEQKIAWAGDLLNRKEVAELLTDYIDTADHVKVVNIDSPWGTGKTFFLSNWRASLFDSRAVVYFNAWENDFTGDPMISLIANIRDQLKEFLPATAIARKGLKNFLHRGGSAVVAAAPVVARGLIRKTIGFDLGELSQSDDEYTGADCESAEVVAEKFVERLIASNSERIMSIERFKESLSSLARYAMKETGKPVYIFIDELDRCRPTYAIELLERVKHIFDVKECKFIVASDTAQLVHSIRAVYGGGFDSKSYLKRFFDMSYSFGDPDTREWVIVNVDIECPELLGFVRAREDLPKFRRQSYVEPGRNTFYGGKMSEAQIVFYLLSRCFKVELRQLERIMHTLALVVSKSSAGKVDFFYAAYLCFLHAVDESLFEQYVENGSAARVVKIIVEKFPAVDTLYFLYSNQTVHDIANSYQAVGNASQDALYKIQNQGGVQYVVNLAGSRIDSKWNLDRYPQLIKLAVGVE